MDPKQGSLAVEWLQPRVAVPMHYDTWDVIKQDVSAFTDFTSSLVKDAVKVIPMKPGERVDISPFLTSDHSCHQSEPFESS